MALIFCDGFDHYATADILKKWSAIGSGQTIQKTIKRNGMSALYTSGGYIQKSIANQQTVILGFAHYQDPSSTSYNRVFVSFLDGVYIQIKLILNSDYSIGVYQNNTLLGTTSPIITPGTWCYLEIGVVFNATTGSIIIRKNEIEVFNLSNINTITTSNTYCNNVKLSGGSWFMWYIDDLYIDDSNFLGDIKVETLYPSGAGTTTQWDALSGNNYENVDETTQDGDTSYVSTATANEIDTYTFGNLATTSGTVHGVQVNIIARKDDAGSRSIAPVVRPSNTDRIGNSVSVSDSYTDYTQTYATNPDNNEAWTIADVNGAEFGVKLIE